MIRPRRIWKINVPWSLAENKSLEETLQEMNQSAMGNEKIRHEKIVRSVSFTKETLLPEAATPSFLEQKTQIEVPLLLVQSVLLYSTRPRARRSSVHMDARA